MADMDAEKALKLIAQSVRVRKEWREQAKEDFAFVAGHQWAEEVLTLLDAAGRPHTTFNEIGPIVDAIAGHEVSNRQAVSYIPRQVGMAGVNEVLTAAADWIREESDSDSEESAAFYDATVCGEGWTDTEIEHDEDLDGRIGVNRVDPLEMDVDTLSTRKNYSDAKWLNRTKVYTREEALERWPDGEFSSANDKREPDSPVDVIAAAFYKSDSGEGGRPSSETDRVLVHDFQWWEHETIYRVPAKFIPPQIAHLLMKGYMPGPPVEDAEPMMQPQDLKPDGNGFITFPDDVWNRLTKESGLPPDIFKEAVKAKAVLKQKKRCYYRMYISAEEELERKETPTGDSFTYKAMTGKRDHKQRSWYGVVRAMKDPQRWANKFMSSMLEVISHSAKGGVMYETDAFIDVRQAEEDWADPSKNIPMTEGAISGEKVMPRPTNNMPPQMQSLMTYAAQKIPATAGVNPEVMGLSQALDPSGVMEEGRRQSGLNMLSYLFDSLRRYRKEQGRLLLRMIKKFIPPGRLIKITGPEGAQFVPLAYDENTLEYDVEVDEAPTSPNVKQKTWDNYTAILPEMPWLGSPQIAMQMMDYSPFPAALVQKLKQQQQQQAQQPPPPPPPEVQAKIASDTANANLKNAQAQNLGQDAQLRAMEAQATMYAAQQKGNAEIQKAQFDFMTAVAKYHQMIADGNQKAATGQFNHAKSLFDTITAAHKTVQAAHGTAQAQHGTAQALHGTIQSAHQTVQTLNQPETPNAAE